MPERPRPVPGGRSRRVGLITALLLLTASAAGAGLTSSSSASHSLSSGSIQPPTDPAVTPGTCVVLLGDGLVVSWTRTASPWADGYEVLRSTTSGGPYSVVGSVTGQATESYTDSGLAFATTYHYVVRATKASWRSAPTAQVSRTTRSALCL